MTPFDKDFGTPVEMAINGKARTFDIDDPDLPDWVAQAHRTSGDYPYKDKYKTKEYEKELAALQVELVKLQYWQQATGTRIICLFEGRDAAGKGGCIKAITQNMNPRNTSVVALPKPSDRERGQWYFQRYTAHLASAGEISLFDRSWYNRAGVEPVMGFCTQTEYQAFLREAPMFEAALTRDGILLFKFWLAIGRETQLKRFHDRRHDRRKIWKLSPMDIQALGKWDDYGRARDTMLRATHTTHAPWTVVRMNDKKRGRLSLIRHFLGHIDYDGRDRDVVGTPDPALVIDGATYVGD
ncbi:MAG: polyphosphate kinase 2 [Parvularcula sp.]